MAETEEYETLRALVPELRDAVGLHLVPLSGHLFAKGLITEDQEIELRNESKSKASRAADLVSMMMNKVKLDPTYFQKFIDILRSNGVPNIDNLLSEPKLKLRVNPICKQKVPSATKVSRTALSSARKQTHYTSARMQTRYTNRMQLTIGAECKCHICTSDLRCSSTVVKFSLLDSDQRGKEDFKERLRVVE